MTIKKTACRPEPTLQLAAVSVSGSTCFCCSAFQNQRLLNLSLFSKNVFSLETLACIPICASYIPSLYLVYLAIY